MTSLNNRAYYRRRAEQAAALADAATMPSVKNIHRSMAAHYTSLAEADLAELSRPMLRLVF